MSTGSFSRLIQVLVLGCMAPGVAAAAVCHHPQGHVRLDPYGDVNGSGAVNVADALCSILCGFAQMDSLALPGCVAPVLVEFGADMNCDGNQDVSDVLLVVQSSLGIPLAVATGSDGCPAACEPCAPSGLASCFIQGACIPENTAQPGVNCFGCHPAASTTSYSASPNGAACNDGIPCTSVDTCEEGSCAGTNCAPRLVALSLSAGALQPAFQADQFAYTVLVSNETTEISLTATAGAGLALAIEGASVASGSEAGPFALPVGESQISVEVMEPVTGAWQQVYTLTIERAGDTTPPDAPQIVSPAANPSITASNFVSIEGSCEIGALVMVTGAIEADSLCEDGTFLFGIESVVDGSFVVAIEQTDEAGNTSAPTEFTWIRDTVPPPPPVPTTQSPALNNASQFTIEGTCGNGLNVTLSGASSGSTACSGGVFSFAVSASSDGIRNYTVRQVKPQPPLTSSGVQVVWVRDTVAPDAPVLTAPSGNPHLSGDPSVEFVGWCETGSIVQLSGAATDSTPCAGGHFEFEVLASTNGEFGYDLVQVDAAGNVSQPLQFTWVRDNTVPPTPQITSPAQSSYASSTSGLTLSGVCTNGYTVILQGASTQNQACTTGVYSFVFTTDVDGTYLFTLVQESATGVQSPPVPFTWLRDTQAPLEVTMTAPPSNPYFSGNDSLTISGECEPGASVSVTGAETTTLPCPTGSFSLQVSRTANATFNFNFVQTDTAGNASVPLLFQWVRDATIPPTPTLTAPTAPVFSTSNSLLIEGVCEPSFEVSLTGASSQSQTCASGNFSFTVDASVDGTRVYSIRQTNPLTFLESGSVGVTWHRDTTPPASVAITSPTANPYSSGDSTFALQGTCEVAATVSLTGAQIGSVTCFSGTFSFNITKSFNGTYDFTLRQTDRAGNQSPPLAFRWIRDNSVPPTPVISSPNPNPFVSNQSALTISGSCVSGNPVHLSGAGTATTTCVSGSFSFVSNKSADNTYIYQVTQESAANGLLSTAVTVTWTRDTVPPGAPSLASISPISPSSNPNPKVVGTVASGTTTVQVFKTNNCSGGVAASGLPGTYTGLGITVPATLQATMQVSVRALDAAGNASTCSSSLSFTHRAPQLVKDINLAGGGSSSPSNFGQVGNLILFRATDGINGDELWASDGTAAGTYMVKDINTSDVSSPSLVTNFNGLAFFSADDGEYGRELWRSDGTEEGTYMVADINEGGMDSSPAQFMVVGDTLYFTADNGVHGVELWKTDGTDEGTVLVKDIEPGAGSSTPTQLTPIGSRVVFRATTLEHGIELWRSDGSAAGTTVFDINPGTDANGVALNSSANVLTPMGSYVYFNAVTAAYGAELWRTNGTTAELVVDLYPGATSGAAAAFAAAGSTLFMSARTLTPATGYEVFKYTTSGGAVLVKELVAGSGASSPTNFRAISSTKVVFRARFPTGSVNEQLWVSDGTEAGTFLLANFLGGTTADNAIVPVVSGGRAWFSATTSTDTELWSTDGTVAGTIKYDINPGTQSSAPSAITPFGSGVVFSALNLDTGREPWFADATGARLLADINEVPSSGPASHAALGSTVFFAAEDGINGRELWKTDGTLAGTVMVKDINPAAGASSNPTLLTTAGSYVYFRADNGTNGVELWRTDGSAAGTVMVTDIRPGAASSTPASLIARGTQLLFSANDGTTGIELWGVTGTGAATLIRDIYAGVTSSTPVVPVLLSNKVYFRATTSSQGAELWVTDGTTAGTVLLKDVRTGSSSSSPNLLTVVGNLIYFIGNDGTTGSELHVTDGTAAGTLRVLDLFPGTLSSSPTNLRALSNNILLYSAIGPTTGRELYKVTGTASASLTPALVRDIRPGLANSNPGAGIVLGGKLYFPAIDDIAGNELWESDGTTAGTVRLLDIRPGTANSSPGGLIAIDANTFFFTANDGVNGFEPWRSNRTAQGTYMISDINPTGRGWGGGGIVLNGVVHFGATDGVLGVEPWKY